MNRVDEIINRIMARDKTEEDVIQIHNELVNCDWTMEEQVKLMYSGYTEMLAMTYDAIMLKKQQSV
ncbi:MAG: hypothetical protein E7263_06090 [Lachnospiraceae bacterium]|nr:hypothetical protein [Lachnospiraceae bacterium]